MLLLVRYAQLLHVCVPWFGHPTRTLRYVQTVCCVQTVGMNMGYFTSFTLFLALNDADFSNRYLRSGDQHNAEVGVLSLAGYFRFWAVVYGVVTVAVWALKREAPPPAAAHGALCAPRLACLAVISQIMTAFFRFRVLSCICRCSRDSPLARDGTQSLAAALSQVLHRQASGRTIP